MIKVNIASAEKRLEIERRHRRENTQKSVSGNETVNLSVLVDQICTLQERIAELEQKLEKPND
jgi:hypothetical protein